MNKMVTLHLLGIRLFGRCDDCQNKKTFLTLRQDCIDNYHWKYQCNECDKHSKAHHKAIFSEHYKRDKNENM